MFFFLIITILCVHITSIQAVHLVLEYSRAIVYSNAVV